MAKVHPGIESFVEQQGLNPAYTKSIQVLFDSIRGDPERPIQSYLRKSKLDARLCDELVALYVDVTSIAERYHYVDQIGEGGMGEVWRVRDAVFDRHVAMKVLLRKHIDKPRLISRFKLEWRILAALDHPNIPTVFDQGRLTDGRPWFTMPLIEGHDFDHMVKAAHVHVQPGQWGPGTRGWPAIQRVLRGYLGVCRAVAIAHKQGVVHRDLSASNIRLGSHEQPYVLDWGVARWRRHETDPTEGDLRHWPTGLGDDGRSHRTAGIIGSPPYLAPEQARMEHDKVDERSDVYTLGVLLYLILSNRLPYSGPDWRSIVEQVKHGPPRLDPGPRNSSATFTMTSDPGTSPSGSDRNGVPLALKSICHRAMAREPGERFESADALTNAMQEWLEGVRLREQALSLVSQATERQPQIEASNALAREFRESSERILAQIEGWQPEEARWPAWELERRAEEAEQQAIEETVAAQREFYAALQLVPMLEEAHEALVERYMARHERAEKHRDSADGVRAESGMRLHMQALPPTHKVRKRADAYLQGNGRLSLVTTPPGASVQLYAYVERHRRLQLEHRGDFGSEPIENYVLPTGSYHLVIRAPGRATVRYPVEVPRLGHWDARTPPVWLPPADALADDEIYVPEGWFHSGGDEDEAYNNHPAARVWVSGFVMQRDPVTNRAYAAFLQDCSPEEAEAYVPRRRTEAGQAVGDALFVLRDGRYALPDPALARRPVTNIDWSSAMAYLRWRERQDGKPWRLPGDFEWEKAARGVDGRIHPWGQHIDSAWCCMFSSHRGRRGAVPVDDPRYVETDISPYGVRGLGGNVRDWCFDAGGVVKHGRALPPEAVSEGEMAIVRGGTWQYGGRNARSTSRPRERTFERYGFLGFRGVYPLGPDSFTYREFTEL
ncbi:MAG: bifunctional serine/threonine-protein kinase/formylglycine-generating enzyme family protein [Myxococcota bacterium]